MCRCQFLSSIDDNADLLLHDRVFSAHVLEFQVRYGIKLYNLDSHTRGIFFCKAILNDECAKPVIDSTARQRSRRARKDDKLAYLIRIIHCHGHTRSFEVVYIHNFCLSIWWSKHKLKFTRSRRHKICRSILRFALCQCTVYRRPMWQ